MMTDKSLLYPHFLSNIIGKEFQSKCTADCQFWVYQISQSNFILYGDLNLADLPWIIDSESRLSMIFCGGGCGDKGDVKNWPIF